MNFQRAKIREELLKNLTKAEDEGKRTCKHCAETIVFVKKEGRHIPHNPDKTPHWQTCPWSGFVQRKESLNLLKKVGSYLFLELHASNTPLEQALKLTPRETRTLQFIVARALKEEIVKGGSLPEEPHGAMPPGSELTFDPEPTDPIGDPDEDRSPVESEVQILEKKIYSKDTVNLNSQVFIEGLLEDSQKEGQHGPNV